MRICFMGFLVFMPFLIPAYLILQLFMAIDPAITEGAVAAFIIPYNWLMELLGMF